MEFKSAISKLKVIRQRDGAFSWELTEDVAEKGRYIEIFFLESWNQHLHQHTRVAEPDKLIEEEVKKFHKGLEKPRVTHLLISKIKKKKGD